MTGWRQSTKGLVWGATALGAIFIVLAVGYSFFAARNRPPAVGVAPPRVEAEGREQTPVSSMPASPAAETLRGTVPPVPAAPHVFKSSPEPELQLDNLAGTLRVRLPDTMPGQRIPLLHTCYRNNVSPALAWSGAPQGSRSLVAVLEDRKDNNKPVWLWELFDINPAAKGLAQGIPAGGDLSNGTRQAKNIYGRPEYTGPCEPRGQIPYAVRLFALDDVPDLPGGASREDLIRAMNGHIIDATEFDFVHYLKF